MAWALLKCNPSAPQKGSRFKSLHMRVNEFLVDIKKDLGAISSQG